MTMHDCLERAKDLLRQSRIYDSTIDLMKWDQITYMPKTAYDYRAKMSVYFTNKRIELFANKECADLADKFRAASDSDYETDIERAVARRFLFNYKNATGTPAELQSQIAEQHFLNDSAWLEARRQNDYNIWKPELKKYFDLKYKAARLADPDKHPLESIINFYDEDLTVETCGRLLGELKTAMSALMFEVLPYAQEVDDSILNIFHGHVKEIDELSAFMCHRFGYTADMASYAKVVHGWSAMLGPRDSRVTVANTDVGLDNFFTYAHEMGHSLYSRGSSEEVIEAGIWGGMKCSAHESQSRFYENIIARSPEFWQFFFPFMQERFPELRSWNYRDFFRVLVKVKPDFKRVSADELTYNLHPVIRFELERELFEGTLDFDHLSERWNDKYEESLGIRPTNDLEGVLQDIHWTEDFGKFQSYSMGNIFDGQLLQGVLRDIPDFYEQITRGEFEDVHNWMHDKIHQHGFTYPTMAVMERATGEKVNSQYYIDYMRKKYRDIYGVQG